MKEDCTGRVEIGLQKVHVPGHALGDIPTVSAAKAPMNAKNENVGHGTAA